MPYAIKKEKCKKSDGGSGTHRLRYTDKKGKKHSSCHSSKKSAQGSIAAIEMRRESNEMNTEDSALRSLIREMIASEYDLSMLSELSTQDNMSIDQDAEAFVDLEDMSDVPEDADPWEWATVPIN